MPAAADCFQDREIAERLRRAAAAEGTVVLCQVLAGMGGVGKTQLAAAYARDARERGVRVLVWAGASSRAEIIAAYAEAAVKLGVGEREDPERAAREFLIWADTTTIPWLIVLDDLHDPADLRGLWPPASVSGTAVVTTRRRDAALAGPHRHLVHVGIYNLEEARAYLRAKLGALAGDQTGDQADQPAAEEVRELDALAEELGRLPLALAQAAAFMIDQEIGCARYRHLLAGKLLAHTVPETGGLPDDHQRIIAATWDLSIEQADRARPAGLARPLLNLVSVLDPNGIPATVLTSPPARHYLAAYLSAPPLDTTETGPEADLDVEVERVDQALRVLHRFSLIDHDRGALHREVRVHQLIQRATRENIATQPDLGPELFAELAHTAADALLAAWPDAERDQIGTVLRANTTTLETSTGTALWEGGGEKTSHEAHPVLSRAATSLGESGQVSAAIAEYTRLHATATRLLRPDHPDTLTTRHHLARWLGEAGDVAGAATAYQELHTDRLRVLGPDHPDTLTTRGNLARWLGQAGDVAGAATAFQDLLTDFLRVLGPDHPDTLTTRGNLAYWLGQAGDVAGASTAYQDLLTDYLRVLGPDHPDTLTTRGNLAYWLGEAGDVAGAATAFQDLLTDVLRVLGPDHPDTLTTRGNLARWLGQAGDVAGAATAFQDLLTDVLRVLGPDHPHTLTTRGNLANWLGQAGDVAGASTAYQDLLTDYLRVLGPDHPHTLTTRHNLAYWLGQAGDVAGAATAFQDLLTDVLRVLGPDHPDTLTTRHNLAYWARRRQEEVDDLSGEGS
ncbi:tetratricopeptide repeat protein [Herbidospora sp. NEAU-GS84]|uniref:Tetratricopeptide repeat protein n=1 Tax=Herbidospora solisilvae TaxID=2696284 RepID=A0A7C9IZT6_9ACTN|nr:tetratricopeptide repeat protein [Herbidospora solisilvae]